MLRLTPQERLVLLFSALAILSGSILHYASTLPGLNGLMHLIDGDRVYPKKDINTATYEELITIPYIGDSTAQRIIEYRTNRGKISSLRELLAIKGIKEKSFGIFSKYLKITSR